MRSPQACQYVIVPSPKIAGMSQFHKLMTTNPNKAMNTIANGSMMITRFRM